MKGGIEQSLAADGALACFSSNLFLLSLNADRAPQLKARVIPTLMEQRKRIRDEELAGVLRSDGATRYSHFVSQVADWQLVWGLRAPDGWVSLSDETEAPMFPVWPHEPYARLVATGLWANTVPTPIEVHEWVAKWLPALAQDGSKIAVFPTPEGKGVVVEPKHLGRDIQDELARLE